MKVYRLTCLATLALFTLIGLISIPFMPTIAAALRLPVSHQSSTIGVSSTAHSSVPTRVVTKATPAITPGTAAVLAADNFQRAEHVFWGKASDGHIWGGEANRNPDFAIANRSGRIIHGHSIYNAVLGARCADAEIVFSASLSSFQHNNVGAVLRWNDGSHWYKAYIDGVRLILARDVAGVITTLAAVPFPASAHTSYTLRFRMQGTQLLARAWPSGQTEPRVWLAKVSDAAIAAGFAGLRLIVQNGAEAIVSGFTEVAVVSPQ